MSVPALAPKSFGDLAAYLIGTRRRMSSWVMMRRPCSFRALNVRRVNLIRRKPLSTSESIAAHNAPKIHRSGDAIVLRTREIFGRPTQRFLHTPDFIGRWRNAHAIA